MAGGFKRFHKTADQVSFVVKCPCVLSIDEVTDSGFEEDFVLDDINLSDFCQTWDTRTIPEIPPSPVDIQMEIDVMHRCMHHGFDQNNDMPSGSDISRKEVFYGSPYPLDTIPRREEHQERCMTGNMEPKAIPEMDVKKPRVNLVLDSNVVRLDSRFCPKPSVQVLPSHVIQTPQMAVKTQRTAAPYHSAGCCGDNARCLLPTDGWHGEGYDWSVEEQPYSMEHMPVYEGDLEAMYAVRARGCGDHSGYGEMMMDAIQTPNPFPFLAHVGFDDSAQYYPMSMFERADDAHSRKILRKNTKGDKAPGFVSLAEAEEGTVESVAERLDACQIESQSREIRKIQSMSEADICNYVKTMAPQLQNNALEEIVKETKFEERLAKAEEKMQEHMNELEQIREQVACGELHPKVGAEMMRKIYTRREAAVSRTRREQGLVKAAIKKRTLEKICSWMRENLFGNSELFSMNSMDSEVRCSRNDGTQHTCEESVVQ